MGNNKMALSLFALIMIIQTNGVWSAGAVSGAAVATGSKVVTSASTTAVSSSVAVSADSSESSSGIYASGLIAKVPISASDLAIKVTCAMKYENDLKNMFSSVSESSDGTVAITSKSIMDLKVTDSKGIEVGVGKCGCKDTDTAYIDYKVDDSDNKDALKRVCYDSNGDIRESKTSTDDEDWCDSCLETELISQFSGTCGCPDGWTARIDNGVVYCNGADGKVVARQDDTELTSSLKYLAGLDSAKYDSDGALSLVQYQGMSATSSSVTGTSLSIMSTKVKINLNTSVCEQVLADANAIDSSLIAAGADASSVIKSDSKCYYRSPAGEDFEVDSQYQRACKNTASIDEEQEKQLVAVPLSLSGGAKSLISK